MSEDLVNIEVNGVPLQARKGAMLIEATDAAGITVPRFCYHKKLSIAANCRMCLVEVEKAPKPLPACATPVAEGMKVQTQSPRALAAQKGTMEFLLINHPLDCPICDQGGECELQDVAMGYGGDVSRFVERKRVVKDKDIGPLVATDMTRCIHCTRCVRFGEEIAGLREMGATGRGENVEIGTYVKKALASEISGNIIDLCPVGALTAKPSRYTARAWEMTQHPGLAVHDGIGSNVFFHLRQGRVLRVVPRENEPVNETWLSDRDRFSYQGLYAEDRALVPLVRDNARLVEVDWEAALETAAARLKDVIARHGADQVGVLVSPSASVEELYLVQKLARSLGIANIDHRLQQLDFANDAVAVPAPLLGLALADVEKLNAALLVGSNLRMELPLLALRLRKAVLAGGKVAVLNPADYAFTHALAAKRIVSPAELVSALARIAAAVAALKGVGAPAQAGEASEAEAAIAKLLVKGGSKAVILGQLAVAHPAYAQLARLASFIAAHTGASVGTLAPGANAVGAVLAGALPRHGAGLKPAAKAGLDARAMLAQPRKAYLLLGVEPELEAALPAQAVAALAQAELVLALNGYVGGALAAHADLVLPLAAYAETSGTYVNLEGRWQACAGAAKPQGQARPGWKVLRVLGNLLGLAGFDYLSSDEVVAELKTQVGDALPATAVAAEIGPIEAADALVRLGEVGIYAGDAVVRRAEALQKTSLAVLAELRVNAAQAVELGLIEGAEAVVVQDGAEVRLPVRLDDALPRGCVAVPAALPATAALGARFGRIEVRPA